MELLILDHEQVVALLPMADCIAAMRAAFTALAKGQVVQPARSLIDPPGAKGVMLLMPCYLDDGEQTPVFGLKTINIFHGNAEHGLESHQGAVMLFSGETGEPLAVMNASAITAIRTAAVSALAADILARANAGVLAIIGAGVQARSHLQAMACVRPLREARIASRDPASAERFAHEQQDDYAFPIRAAASAEEAVRGADLIVTATTSSTPVLGREWIAPGAHITAVGAYRPDAREIDGATVAASKFYVDLRVAAEQEAGDYLIPLRAGLIGRDHIRAEIGELLLGAGEGRSSEDEITCFKSLGLPIEDLAAAAQLYRKARDAGAGARVSF